MSQYEMLLNNQMATDIATIAPAIVIRAIPRPVSLAGFDSTFDRTANEVVMPARPAVMAPSPLAILSAGMNASTRTETARSPTALAILSKASALSCS